MSPDARRAVRAMLAGKLQILKKHNVSLAIGSDSYRETSVPEALSLHHLNVFDNLTLLKMWCETTAATIFPKRRSGHLKPGYEASFLVLGGDPIADFANVQKIETRVKQGELITLSGVPRDWSSTCFAGRADGFSDHKASVCV